MVCYLSPVVTEDGTIQLLVFAGTSLLSLLALRPAAMRMLGVKDAPRGGSEAFVGKTARTLSVLRKGNGTGRVLFDGTEWSAVLDGDDELPEGMPVVITEVEGLTLHVQAKK